MASKRALLVAINNYGSQQNNLPSCLEDATQFRSLLEQRYGFTEFQELYDRDASVANVEGGLGWLFENVAEDDRLVFFYSGHGFQQPKDENLEECLVLGDMKFLFDDRLTELSQSAPPGVLTVVLDSCFSGGMQKRVALDGRVEIARTKAWMPTPNTALQQQKLLAGRPLVPRPFGCWQVTSAEGVKQLVLGRPAAGTKAGTGAAGGEDEAAQVMLNGLLLSACSENETASASTSATEGMSAFSFALRQAFEGLEGEPTTAALHEAARAKLQEMGFQQTPLLKSPAEPADMASMGFVTLSAAAPAQPAKSARKAVAPAARGGGQQARPAAAQPGPRPAGNGAGGTGAAADAAAGNGGTGGGEAAPVRNGAGGPPQLAAPAAAASAAAGGSDAEGGDAGSGSNGSSPARQGPAATDTPVNASNEESTMEPMMQQNDEKWIGLAAGIAASVVGAMRGKDFAPEPATTLPAPSGTAGPEEATTRPANPRPVPPRPAAVPPQPDGDAGDDAEAKWVAALARVAVPAAISAVPGIINAVRGKEMEAAAPPPAAAAEGDEKWIPLAVGVAASLVPEVIRAVRRRKDFAPEPGPVADAGGDADEKWVAALARVAVPAAISAVPGVINAIRGKDLGQSFEVPAQAAPAAGDEKAWNEALAPVIDRVARSIRGAGKIYPPPAHPRGGYNIAAF